MLRRNRPAAILSAALLLQAAVFYGFTPGEAPAIAPPLDRFPRAVSGWRATKEAAVEKEVRDVLRADDYLDREYTASPADTANLFVASFKSQRSGQSPHSPKNCLPGSGWIWSI